MSSGDSSRRSRSTAGDRTPARSAVTGPGRRPRSARARAPRRARGRARPRSPRGPRQGAARRRSRRQRGEPLPGQVPQPALHAVADDGVAHGLADRRTPPAAGPGGGHAARSADRSRWTTSVRRAGRRPRRTARRKSSLGGEAVRLRGARRAPAGSGRQTASSCGPCGDARTGSRGRRGCACAGGSRAPCARRRLFGWYVRLLTATSPKVAKGWSSVRTRDVGRLRSAGTARPRGARPVAASRTCGTRRHVGDRPTVRGGRRGGQTASPPPRPGHVR